MVADRKRWSSLQLVALPVLTRRVWGGKLVLATRQIKCCWIFGSYREACQLCQKHWQWATYHFHIFSPFEVIAKSGILSFQPKIKGNPVQCIYVTNRVKLPWKKIGLLTELLQSWHWEIRLGWTTQHTRTLKHVFYFCTIYIDCNPPWKVINKTNKSGVYFSI